MLSIKRILFLVLVSTTFLLSSCESSEVEDIPCGTHNGNQLYKGPRGGCYYLNSSNNKTYVDRSECNC